MPDTAVLAVWDAIGAAIDAGTNWPGALGVPRWYRNGEVPVTAPLGYFLLGQAPEGEAGFYNGQAGQSGTYRIHCWATTATNAARLYGWLKSILQDRKLTLAGHVMWQGGALTKHGEQADADGKAWQVPADYDVETLEAA